MIVFDHRQKGLSHAQINALIISILANQISTTNRLYLFSEEEHYKALLQIYKKHKIDIDNKINYLKIDIPHDISVREYKRLFSEIKILLKILIFTIKNKETDIISLYTSVWQLYLFIIFSFIFPHIKFYSIIHGELERIILTKYKTMPLKFLYHLFLGIALPLNIRVKKNFKYIVLGESIKKNLISKKTFLKNNIIAIDHGYIFNEHLNYRKNFGKKLKFGIFGMIFEEKNGTNLIALLNKLNEIPDKNFEIDLIGHIRQENMYKELKKYSFVNIHAEIKKFLSAEEFDKLAQEIDYAIFTYDRSLFKLTASGTFWDPISYYKPIITLKNDYFNYYFNKYKDIGYISENIENLFDIIFKILKKPDINIYNSQINNIKKLRDDIIDKYNYIMKF